MDQILREKGGGFSERDVGVCGRHDFPGKNIGIGRKPLGFILLYYNEHYVRALSFP